MTDVVLALVPHYGPWVLAIATFLSCLALPAPASLLMIAGGAFVASGDLSLVYTAGAAFAGAVGLCLFAAHPQDEWWDFEQPQGGTGGRSLRRAVKWFKENW